MTRSTARSHDSNHDALHYESSVWKESTGWPGVRYLVRRMSLLRRHELVQELRDLSQEQTFHAAWADSASEIAVAQLQGRINACAIRAGLQELEGLQIDGEPATVDRLLELGPEGLAVEIAGAIADESFLSEQERKN